MMQFTPNTKMTLTWRRPRMFRREYELLAGEQLVACQRLKGVMSWQGEIFTGGWAGELALRFRRSGVLRPKLYIEALDLRFPGVAKPAPISLRGEVNLVLDNGRSYHFRPANFWHTRWQLNDEQGLECLILQRSKWGFGGEMTILNPNLPQDELLFLIYVAWHITILKMEEQAAAAAAAS